MMEITHSDNKIFLPGEKIVQDDNSFGGPGTYSQKGSVFSSVLGQLHVEENENKVTYSVKQGTPSSVVPQVGDVVTVKITNVVNPRFFKCNIICVKDDVLKDCYRAIIRREDMVAANQDSIQLYCCFRPGDIVLARVLALAKAHSYILTTAENELGVVIAYSETGSRLVPISWTEMQCPTTYMKESRKVAKVAQVTLQSDLKTESN